MNLPIEFIEKYKSLLGDDFEKFYESLIMGSRFHGIHVNTTKISYNILEELLNKRLNKIPWAQNGYYVEDEWELGKNPLYYAGLYYIQEPSAMFPVEVLDPKPGDKVLDLCASPGGKTIQIASKIKNEGIIVTNDINQSRIKPLLKNIELFGVKNSIVTNDSPQKLSLCFESYFDKILIDAPCSGDGMFRKDKDAIKSWLKYKSEDCAKIQYEIITNAKKMLKKDGIIVYSTCSFSPLENEGIISRFIKENNEFIIDEITKVGGISDGKPEWSDDNAEITKTARLWPQNLNGEGHFTAKLRKIDHFNGNIINIPFKVEKLSDKGNNKKSLKKLNSSNEKINKFEEISLKDKIDLFRKFEKESLINSIENIRFENRGIYYNNDIMEQCLNYLKQNNINVSKSGFYLGNIEGKNFIPSHSLVLTLKKNEIKEFVEFKANSIEVLKYLKGETLVNFSGEGFHVVLIDGFSLGWCKLANDNLKNLYPKGWRKLR